MKPILIVYKKSAYEIYKKNKLDVPELKKAHEEHYKTLKLVKSHLSALNIKFNICYRAVLSEKLVNQHSLLIVVGGDGTLLNAANYTRVVPILAVNSSYYVKSEGFYAAANRFNFKKVFNKFLKKKLKIFYLNRLQLELDNQLLPELVLNDVLVAHSKPAAVTRYLLKLGNHVESQKSSGLLIGTPTCNWVLSSGGIVLPTEEKAFQFVAREFYEGRLTKSKLDKVVVKKQSYLEIKSKIRQGMLYIDGYHRLYKFSIDSILRVSNSAYPLSLVGFNEKNRYKYYAKKGFKNFLNRLTIKFK